MKQIQKIITSLDSIISGVSLLLIIFMTVAGVVMRKCFGNPIAWLEEMQIFFFVWTIFLGGSIAFRKGGQVSIDLIAARLNPKARKVLDIFCYVVAMLVLIYLCKGGFELAASVTKKVTPYFKISYKYIDLAAPIGCIIMMVQYTFIILDQLFGVLGGMFEHKDENGEGGVE